jgi:hypothetical protein
VARGGDEFVQRDEIDPRYLIRPYYLRPDGKVGHDAFAVIRDRPLLADCVEKLENRALRKSRECSALVISAAAKLCRIDTSASDHLCGD